MTAKAHAIETTIPVDRTIADIKDFVSRRGAVNVSSTEGDHGGHILFTHGDRCYRLPVEYLPLSHRLFQYTEVRGWGRTDTEARKEWRKHKMSRWRALFFLIRALWTAVEDGLVPFETVFLNWQLVELPDGTESELGAVMAPHIAGALHDGRVRLRYPLPEVLALPAPATAVMRGGR